MQEQPKYRLDLPGKNGAHAQLECDQSVLLIGANGSGKTRLGAWIEMTGPQHKQVHRLSAQKSLLMPDTTTPTSIELAEKGLLFGWHEFRPGQEMAHKMGNKWSSKPATAMLNDYEKLMTYLFSEETEQNAKYKVEQKKAASELNLQKPSWI